MGSRSGNDYPYATARDEEARMVVKRNWRVISGSMAAGAILVPTAAMAQDGIPSLQDIQPYVSESPTSEDAAFYQQIGDGVPVLFDFQSALTADETVLTVASEPSVASEPTVASAQRSE
jgi:hypothetical protein